MKCPYCHKDGVNPPKKNEAHPHGYCPHCDRKPRATVMTVKGVQTVVSYSREATPRPDRKSIKSNRYQLLLSQQDEYDLENGKKQIKLVYGKNGKRLVILLVV